MNASKEINREVGWSIVLSILMIMAGALAIIVPQASGIAVTILVSWLLVLCGAAHLAYAWHTRSGGGLWWGILLGLLCIAAACCLLVQPMAGLKSLTLVLALYLFVASILEFVLAVQLRPLPGSGWLFIDAIITLILAVMIGWTWPSSALWVIGTLVGISMIFGGVARLMISLAARRVAKAIGPEAREPAPAH